MADKKRNENGEQTKSYTVALLMDTFNSKIESIRSENERGHAEIRLDFKNQTKELSDKLSILNERLIKIESSPAHEKFQQVFCPNTGDIKDLVSWISEHKEVHKQLMEQLKRMDEHVDKFVELIREDRKNFEEERLRDRMEGMKRMKWAILGIIFTAIGSISVAIILSLIGIG